MAKRLTFFLTILMLTLLPTAMFSQQLTVSKLYSGAGGTSVSVKTQNYSAGQVALIWSKSGTVSGCTIQIESSSDNSSFGLAAGTAAQTCTSTGNYIVFIAPANYLRMNVTSWTGTGSIQARLVAFTNTPTSAMSDGWFNLGPENCSISQASGTETVASVLKVVGNVRAVQETTTTTTATHTVICKISLPSKLTAGHGVIISDVVLNYGNSTGNIATCNAPTVGSQTNVAAGTGETPASATLVSAGGSLTVTPVVGSCNTTAVSAGQFYTEKIAFGTPIVMNTDQQTIYVTQSFVGPTNATFTLNIGGMDVHYSLMPM